MEISCLLQQFLKWLIPIYLFLFTPAIIGQNIQLDIDTLNTICEDQVEFSLDRDSLKVTFLHADEGIDKGDYYKVPIFGGVYPPSLEYINSIEFGTGFEAFRFTLFCDSPCISWNGKWYEKKAIFYFDGDFINAKRIYLILKELTYL